MKNSLLILLLTTMAVACQPKQANRPPSLSSIVIAEEEGRVYIDLGLEDDATPPKDIKVNLVVHPVSFALNSAFKSILCSTTCR